MNIRMRKFAAALALLASLAAASGGFAQAAKPAAPAPAKEETVALEKFEVTGSRLTPPDFEAALPVNVYTSQEIAKVTAETVNNYLRFVPTSYGSGNFDESFVNGGNGRALVGLRGLPTLTLINGRRTATGDLNAVPLAAVDRIEILKDGNGAVYGADAVGGVINIITKKKFEGVQVDASYQNTTKNDISRRRFEVVWGNSSDKGSIVLGVAFFKQNDLFSRDRDNVTDTSDRSFGATSATPNPGRFILTAAQNAALFGGTGSASYRVKESVSAASSSADFRVGQYGNVPAAQSDRFPFALYTPAVRPAKRFNIFSSAEYNLFEKTLTFYSDIAYMRSYTQAGLAPSPASFSASSNAANDFRIPATNYWMQKIFGAKAVDITSWAYRFVDFGPRNNDGRFDDTALTGGFKGAITDRYGYDISYHWNRNERLDIERNGVNRARLQEVIQGRNATFTGARSFNPFTNPFDTGKISNDPDMLNYIRLEPRTTRDTTTAVANVTLNGRPVDLPAGPLEGVVGYEERTEDFVRTPDLAKQQAAGSGWNSTSATATHFKVKSLFGEAIVPVLADAPFAKKLQVGAAVRQEKFSHLKKDATVGRLYLRDQVNSEITARLSYSEGYTAPSPDALTAPAAQSFPSIFMPWLGVSDQPNQGVQLVGNPNLSPTTSKSYNAGVVYSPKALKGFTFTLDYYKIKQANIIIQDGQLYVDVFNKAGGLTKNANGTYTKNNSAPFASRIDIDTDGSRTGIPGYIVSIAPVPYENAASLDADGLDFELAYRHKLANFGNLTYRLNGTRILKYDMVKLAGLPATKYAGFFTPNDGVGPGTVPHWRGTFQTDWDWNRYSATVKLNYTGSYGEDPDGGDNFTATVSSWLTVDATVGFSLDKWGHTTLRAGVENAFNRMPPRALSSFADKYDRSMHNILGAMWTVKMTQRF